MKKFQLIAVALIIFVGLTSCDKDIEGLPQAIEDLKNDYSNNSFSCDKLYSYTFQEATVYLFSSSACVDDAFTTVYAENGEKLCDLGGKAGLVDCNGDIFHENAEDETLLWEE